MKNKQTVFNVSGMHCASCARNVELTVGKLESVSSASVNLAGESASVSYDAEKISEYEIIDAINKLGFKASLPTPDNANEADKALFSEKTKLIVAIIFAALLFIISMGPMLGIFSLPYPISEPEVLCTLQLILVLPVIVCGFRFYISGVKSLLRAVPNMDTLIAIGTFAALAYSIYSSVLVYTGDAHAVHNLYFESAGMIIAFVMLGKFLEKSATKRTTESIKKLMSLTPETAIILRDGRETEVRIQDVKIDDVAIVRPGERIPIDGVVVLGETEVDESMITGESMPVSKSVGNEVIGGCINRNGFIQVKATRVGKDTALAKIVKTVSDAQASKAPIARLADVVAGYFVPVVIAISLISSIIWFILQHDFSLSLSIFISVLVISCPCALGLATPVAIMVGTGKAAEHGILFRNVAALEHASRVNTIVFDKTGTLTTGKPIVTDIISHLPQDELISLAAACEANSEHLIGEAIVNFCKEKELHISEVENFEYFVGSGVRASVCGEMIYVGNKSFVKSTDKFISAAEKLAEEGKTPVYVANNEKTLGVIAIADALKDSAKDCIDELKKHHIDVYMLTGDNKRTANAIARQISIENVVSEVSPTDKSEAINKLKKEGKTICMVGDGINDAPALASADVSITLSSATDIATEVSDIVIIKNNLLDIPKTIKISSAVTRNIKQNLAWAFAYNAIGIPIAAGILYAFGGPLLNPMVAAAAMSLSSVSVVLNALRLGKTKLK